ncbi:MAG: transglycosylase SLT domain-containing protein, partial [Alphaproteobacteria bacterium]
YTGAVAAPDVRGALQAASKATGVDFAYLAANASLESSLDPAAKAKTSSAAGLFQFIDSTWEDMVERHGAKIGLAKEAEGLASGKLSGLERRRIMDLRYDAGVAARMGAEFAAENQRFLRERLGREPEDVDLYLAHFLGPSGAASFLDRAYATPHGKAAEAFPAAAKANRAIFYDGDRARSFVEIRNRFQAKLDARADDVALLDMPEMATPPFVAAPSTPKMMTMARASEAPALPDEKTTRGFGRDPWISTLLNAQLSMQDSLGRARRDEDERASGEVGRAYRNLLT